MKKLLILALPALLAACGGNRSWQSNITPETEFKIESVNVTLNSKCPAPSFMTEKQLTDRFARTIRNEFCKHRTCTDKVGKNTVVMTINVNYTRTMMGEAVSCSESYGGVTATYDFILKKDGEEFLVRMISEKLAPSRGVVGNLGRIATNLSFTGGPENEMADVAEYLGPGIGQRIERDLRR